ncbi:MAG: hypothetical protein AAGD35_12955 [Actinomycetota bacterium]
MIALAVVLGLVQGQEPRPGRAVLLDRPSGAVSVVVEVDEITGLTWAPDGGLDVSDEWTITRHDLNGGSTTVFDGGRDRLFGHAYAPDGDTIAMVDGGDLRLLDLATGEVAEVEIVVDRAVDAAFISFAPDWSDDGRSVLTGVTLPDEDLGATPSVAVIDVETGTATLLTVDGEPISGTYPRWR